MQTLAPESTRTVNRLTKDQYKALDALVATRRGDIEAGIVSVESLTTQLQMVLGREVTVNNVQGACRRVGVARRVARTAVARSKFDREDESPASIVGPIDPDDRVQELELRLKGMGEVLNSLLRDLDPKLRSTLSLNRDFSPVSV